MTLGSGLAVCGIWAAVAVCAFTIGAFVVPVATLALFATLAIAAP